MPPLNALPAILISGLGVAAAIGVVYKVLGETLNLIPEEVYYDKRTVGEDIAKKGT